MRYVSDMLLAAICSDLGVPSAISVYRVPRPGSGSSGAETEIRRKLGDALGAARDINA